MVSLSNVCLLTGGGGEVLWSDSDSDGTKETKVNSVLIFFFSLIQMVILEERVSSGKNITSILWQQ